MQLGYESRDDTFYNNFNFVRKNVRKIKYYINLLTLNLCNPQIMLSEFRSTFDSSSLSPVSITVGHICVPSSPFQSKPYLSLLPEKYQHNSVAAVVHRKRRAVLSCHKK